MSFARTVLLFLHVAVGVECLRVSQPDSHLYTPDEQAAVPTVKTDEEENPALDGWTELDGSTARAMLRDSHLTNTRHFARRPRHDEMIPSCNDATNFVLPHALHKQAIHFKYSVIPSSFSPPGSATKYCSSVDELLNAVKRGKRVWADGTVNPREPSVFVPDGCKIRHRAPEDVQKVLTKPAVVSIDGDSLTRQMQVGLSMVWSGNYYDSGIAHGEGWEKCTCDGQFSESMLCRKLTQFSFDGELPKRTCAEDGSSPRVFWLQGGPHYMSDPNRTLVEYFQPKIKAMRALYSECAESPTFLLTGLNAQAPFMNVKYPHQRRELAREFNDFIEKKFAKDEKVHIVDFLSLTQDAESSDGYHSLSDVNVVKADVVVSLVDLIYGKWESRRKRRQ